jgi:large subunit ribosomal protein L25
MEELKLVVEKRKGSGTKKELTAIRASSRIPGVIYGGEKPTVEVSLSEKELMDARRKGGANAILHLEVAGTTETVIVKELQRHPVSSRLVHADFQRISLTKKIEARVPLRVVGEAPGVKQNGGVMQHELREIRVRALPTKIPQAIDVDVSMLEIGMHIEVKDLKVPAEVEVLDAPEHLVLNVTVAKEEVAAAPAAAAAATPEGAAAPAEPELASTKGKKDEEGKVIPKEAKAAAAPEKGKEPAKKEGK